MIVAAVIIALCIIPFDTYNKQSLIGSCNPKINKVPIENTLNNG